MILASGPRHSSAGHRPRLRTVVVTAVASSVLGLSAIGAAPASAVSKPKACDSTWINPIPKKATTSVNLRKKSTTSSASLGLLTRGTKFTEYCVDVKGTYWWGWGKVTSGPNAGTYGWVYRQYLRT